MSQAAAGHPPPFQHLRVSEEEAEEEEVPRPSPLSPVYRERRHSDAPQEEPRRPPRRSAAVSSTASVTSAAAHAPALAARRIYTERATAAQALRPESSSAEVHPPLPAELQGQLDALRRKEERWKSRLRSTKTQRLREERVKTKTREEEEERKRREEEEHGERARKALIDTAMRERWGVRPDEDELLQQPHQPSARIEWIRKRDERDRPRAPQATKPTQSAGHRYGRREAERSPPSMRPRERRKEQSDSSDREERKESTGRTERGPRMERAEGSGKSQLFSTAYLRSLGYDEVTDDDEDDNAGEADGDADSFHQSLSRLGLLDSSHAAHAEYR